MINNLLKGVLAASMLFLLLNIFAGCSERAQSDNAQDESVAQAEPTPEPAPEPCDSSDDFGDSSTLEDCWVVGNDKATKMAIFEIDPDNSWFIMDDPVVTPFNGSPAIWKDSEGGDLTVTLKIADMMGTADDGLLFGLDSSVMGQSSSDDLGKYVYFYLLGGKCVVISDTVSNVVPAMDCNTQGKYPFYLRIEKKDDSYNFYYKPSESKDYVLLNDGMTNSQGQDWVGPKFTSKYRVLIAPIVGGTSKEYEAKIDSLTFDVGNAVGQD